MNTTAFSRLTMMFCCTATLAACGSPYSAATLANANNVGGTAVSSGPSVLSNQSQVTANIADGTSIPLPYVIYAPQNDTSDPTKIYGIEFLDYDPCTWGTQHGWSTWPTTSFNQLGFYFPSTPSAADYAVQAGGGTGAINATQGALGTHFVASASSANGASTFSCKATSWLGLSGGTVTVTAFDSSANTVTGTVNLTLNDGSTITGAFKSGTCSDTSMTVASTPDTANACTTEN